jgi:DNA polymerase-3 subunit gamma/tau
MNAVRTKRVHQAYLFTGSRGIGKTSIARIFAKLLRCEKLSDKDGWLKSCDNCSSCKEIAASTSVDVIEIDGASNNGVEAVREIRENAKYMPQTGSRKVYVIDEVHMLTTAAFNALLKTLEEPPEHVIFIFATTEPHKIPATILSRCQRFDFRRVTNAQIQPHLARIAKSEGITAEPAALALISRAAEGSMRDALSLLDQVIAFSGTKVTVESTRESIGLIEGQTVLGILSGIFKRKPLEALALVDQAYQRGHDLRVLTRSLIEFLHGAVLAKIGAQSSGLLELSQEEWTELKQIAEARQLEEIELIFQVLHQGLDWIARSPQPKVVLDILLVKCASAEALVQVEQASSTASPSGPSGKTHSNAPAPAKAAPAVKAAPQTQAAPEQAAPQPQAAPVAKAPIPAPAPAPAQNQNPTWEGWIEHVRKQRPLLASILEHGTATTFPSAQDCAKPDGTVVVAIGFAAADAYFREQLSTPTTQGQLQEISQSYFGKKAHFKIEQQDSGESLASKKKRESENREKAAKEAAHNHPIVREARSLFGTELGSLEIIDGGSA